MRSSHEGRYFSLARAEENPGWELQMLAPADGGTDDSAELQSHLLLTLPEDGPCQMAGDAPRLLPTDWKTARNAAAVEELTVRKLLAALTSPSSTGASGLPRFFKETWSSFQSGLVDRSEALTAPDTITQLREACESRNRRWFRDLDAGSWKEQASVGVVSPLRGEAARLRQSIEAGLPAEIRAFLKTEVAARGLEGLKTLESVLQEVHGPAQSELAKSQAPGRAPGHAHRGCSHGNH